MGLWNTLCTLKIKCPPPVACNAFISLLAIKFVRQFPFTVSFFLQICILWKRFFSVKTEIRTGRCTGKSCGMDHAQEKTEWLVSLSQTYMINFKSMLFPESTLLLCWHFVCSVCAADVSQVTPFPHSVSKVKFLLWVSAKAKALGRVWWLQIRMEQVAGIEGPSAWLDADGNAFQLTLCAAKLGQWWLRGHTTFWAGRQMRAQDFNVFVTHIPTYSEGTCLSVTPESSSGVWQAHAGEVGVPQWTQTEPVALLSLQFEIKDMEQTWTLINTADRLDKPLLEEAETKATILVASWGCFQLNFFIALSARWPDFLP